MEQSPLPAGVQKALEQGRLIEAIELLRKATGLGLAEAKHVLEAHMNGDSVMLSAIRAISPHPEMPPAPIVAALQRGNKLEAIRLFREHTGLGLKEAKDVIEAMQAGGFGHIGLAPGEMSPSGSGRWWLAGILAAVAVLFYFVLQRLA